MNRTNPRNLKVDLYLTTTGCGRCPLGPTPQCKAKRWRNELEELRGILLASGLTEEVKWGVPCYTFQKKNVVLMSGLKEYCALSFMKGALLKDPQDILKKPGENSQVTRLVRFTEIREIIELEPVLKAYVQEAIEVEKAGLKVPLKTTPEPIPEELQMKFEEHPGLKTAFEALTPGRQRGYLLHFSAPRQSKTREARIEKCVPQILAGKGMHDDYKAMRK